MQRVWGGRELEKVYQRELPDKSSPYGESWEICDREDEQTVVAKGPLAGKSLHDLWTNSREEIFGSGFDQIDRFPLLIKILDARDDLSIQVHPPCAVAEQLGGEPKTEMWYIAAASPEAKLYVGLKKNISKADFQAAINNGTVDQAVHAITPKQGDSIFIPSGRLHAIGAGLLIFEIQQNSDTTYRVFDWNRVGLDGAPRELHVEQSMACIDFEDIEPSMDEAQGNTIASCEHFVVDQYQLEQSAEIGNPTSDRFSIIAVVTGQLKDAAGNTYQPGDFALISKGESNLTATEKSTIIQSYIPS